MRRAFLRLVVGGIALVGSGASLHAQDAAIDQIIQAVRVKPRVTFLSQQQRDNLLYYDVKLEKLCDAGSLNLKASQWVDGAQQILWATQTRAAAFTVTIGFPNTNKPAVVLPLIAYSNAAIGRIECNDIIVSDIPADRVITVQFDFSAKSSWRLDDPTPTLNALKDVGSALGGLQVTAGAAVFSYINSSTGALAQITKATNTLLATLDVNRTTRPSSRRFEIDVSKLAYNAGRDNIFSVTKQAKLSMMALGDGSGPFAGANISSNFNVAFPNSNLDVLASNIQSAIPNGWTTQIPAFCNAYRSTLRNATGGDTVAVILALYYHARINDLFYRNAGVNCLTRSEIALLVGQLGYKTPPYDVAYQQPLDGVLVARPATPVTPTRVSLGQIRRTIAVARVNVREVERRFRLAANM